MSMLVEPGTRLAGRYRLEERASETDDSTLWRAIDEPLARPVAVRTFTRDSPRAAPVVAAARAASRVPDSRLAQVFDADGAAEQPYLVSEWIEGDRLLDVVQTGPLEPWRAVRFITEATDAIVAAHAAGLAHLRLDPSSLIWAKGGTVKITGLAIDAALHGLSTDDQAPVIDVRALGALLYAALTAHWPENTDVGLPPAARTGDGWPAPVGETRHDLPTALESIASRALGQQSYDGQPAFESPAALRAALAGLPRLAPLPPQAQLPRELAADGRGEKGGSGDRAAATTSAAAFTSGAESGPYAPKRRGWSPARLVLLTAVGALVLTATALGAWQIGRVLDDSRNGTPTAHASPSASSGAGPTATGQTLSVGGVQDYDPRRLGGDGEAHPEEVGNVLDGKADTFWSTQTYEGQLGPNGLKPGVGLMLDMETRASIAEVRVDLADQGASLSLYAGATPDISEMRKVASQTDVSGQAVLTPQQPVRARYLLVYVTGLPQVSDGYRAQIAEIVVRGTARS